MTKTFIAGLVAASLALTGITATPARADNEQLRNALIGIAALAIIGSAIKNSRSQPAVQPSPPPVAHPNPGFSRVLPAACLVSTAASRGNARIFSRHCLERNYRFAARLPGQCATAVPTRFGPQAGYDPYCLRRAGFSVDRPYRGWDRRWNDHDHDD
jgi:hypothetical protein